jgi:hypothetical protein
MNFSPSQDKGFVLICETEGLGLNGLGMIPAEIRQDTANGFDPTAVRHIF